MIDKIVCGDSLEVLRTMPDCSVDAIVTDPPYGLTTNKKGGSGIASVNLESPYGRARIGTGNGAGGFMGMKWDSDVPSVELWTECLRVLKPGGHLLAFAGTRTQHRMACRIEDAGFEIRDMIAWVYGSGFPKSLDVSKAIDKSSGAERETDAAKQWDGWGTALKPAMEPITVARKPLVGTVAANVLAHGCGGLNIDGCRVSTGDNLNGGAYSGGVRPNSAMGCTGDVGGTSSMLESGGGRLDPSEFRQPVGRWPANFIHDGSDEVVGLFPQTTSGKMKGGTRRAAQDGPGSVCYGTYGGNATSGDTPGDSGSAARFFYCAKASKSERGEGNNHPTVKPINLMRYLVRLVTPVGAIVLDPFAGSGTTLVAAKMENCHYIGIELNSEYHAIAESRLSQGVLF